MLFVRPCVRTQLPEISEFLTRILRFVVSGGFFDFMIPESSKTENMLASKMHGELKSEFREPFLIQLDVCSKYVPITQKYVLNLSQISKFLTIVFAQNTCRLHKDTC